MAQTRKSKRSQSAERKGAIVHRDLAFFFGALDKNLFPVRAFVQGKLGNGQGFGLSSGANRRVGRHTRRDQCSENRAVNTEAHNCFSLDRC